MARVKVYYHITSMVLHCELCRKFYHRIVVYVYFLLREGNDLVYQHRINPVYRIYGKCRVYKIVWQGLP